MKKLKALFLAIGLLVFASAVKAQDLTSQGFTIQVYIGMYDENGEVKSYELNEIYSISFADQIMVHNVLSEDIISDSQVYKVSNLQKKVAEDLLEFSFDATSGISGNVYKYNVALGSGVATMDRTQPNGSSESFLGSSIKLKTFKQ